MMSSENINFANFPFKHNAKTKNIKGRIIPDKSHHFEPITTISSWMPDINGILFGVKKIKRHKHKQKLTDAITIGIILFFFINLR